MILNFQVRGRGRSLHFFSALMLCALVPGLVISPCLGADNPWHPATSRKETGESRAHQPRPHGDSYTVTVQGLPTSVNPEATHQPHFTELALYESDRDNVQRLVLLSYPTRKAFVWSAKNGGDVVLTIGIGDLYLKKTYTGLKGFPAFLKAASGGRLVFQRNEFNAQESEELQKLGVTHISVAFRITNADPVIMLLDKE